ncbi:JAB domain-containing protein [Brevundimonas sp.]|uniref:JAB domain-containing protein n=1 Tax=Brevundimonas sp. TaxID=1871086 RepID=UPI0028A197D8|nr:JAB domain-containing protein [Brevundimonas sp.]
MSTRPAAVFHRQPEPLPEDADQVLLASILERVLPREAGRAAAVEMIATFHGLAGVAAADEAALLRAGLEPGGVAELVRICAMALAMTRAKACDRPVLSSWTALTAYLRAALAHAPREQFRTLYLDRRNILMREECRGDGTVDHAPVYNAGPARVASLGRIPRIRETEQYVESVVECFLALSAGRVVMNARQCRREGAP